MRVLFYSPDAAPVFDEAIKKPIGGAELRAYNFGAYLASKNVNVFFLVNELTLPLIIKKKIKAHAISYYATNKPSLIKRLYIKLNYLFRYKTKIDYENYLKRREVFEIQPNYIFAFGLTGNTLAISKIAKSIKCKLFVFVASDEDLNFSQANTKEKTKLNADFYTANEIITSANTVFVQSDLQNQMVSTLFKVPSQILLNPIQLGKNDLIIEKKFILWVGKSSWYKQPELFIKMASAIPNEFFVMVCNNTDQELFEKILKDKPNNCEVIEYVAANKIEEYFAKCKLFVNTSDFEGFPNTFLQAAKYAKPIVSYRVNPNEFITKYNCGSCAFGDYNQMMKQVDAILRDENLYEERSNNCIAYIQKHNIDVVGSTLLNALS